MGIFTVSEAQHHRLQRLRRNTWKAIALCTALRLADMSVSDVVETNHTLVAQAHRVTSLIAN